MSNTITIDIEELGKVVAKHMPPSVRDNEELWTSEQCAAYLGIRNTESFTQYTASLASFPDRIELPTTRNEKRGQLRWVGSEVIEWALSHKRKKKA